VVQVNSKTKSKHGRSAYREYAKNILAYESGSVPLKRGAPVRIVLVYPNTYSVGMANLGFQTVYRMLNEHPEVRCERAFMYDQSYGCDIRTLESQENVNHFQVIGFSISYELDLINIIKFLLISGIPTLARDRSDRDPLVIVGGAVAGLNPSPLLPIMDGLLVGEGEGVFYQMGDILFEEGKNESTRENKLHALGKIEGFFIPSIHHRIKRRTIESINDYPIYTPIITSLSHFNRMFVVEVSRGCPRSCYFCGAEKIYRPYRYHDMESLLHTVKTKNPGATRIGLEGSGLSDYADFQKLCHRLIEMGKEISLSSIRPDVITRDWLNLMERGGIRTLTIAPETGSENLRYLIGKKIRNRTLINLARLLTKSKINMLKLYFLIGLPNEREKDIQDIIDLVLEMYDIYARYTPNKRIRISVNAFIPKPFTEFQWSSMDTEKELSLKRKLIYQGLNKKKRLTVVSKSAKEELLQGILSLGDEKIGASIIEAVSNRSNWKRVLKEKGLSVESVIHRERSFEESLPWDFIETRISKKKVWDRYQKYRNENVI